MASTISEEKRSAAAEKHREEMLQYFELFRAPANGPRTSRRDSPGQLEVPMAMRSDHLTETEDAAFDSTMKIAGSGLGVLVLAVVAYWYFFS